MPGRPVTPELMREIVAAFNSRDLERIVSYFADDCTFLMSNGPEVVGRTVKGKAALANALGDRFKIIPDMRWEPIYDHVYGNNAVSVWIVKGSLPDAASSTRAAATCGSSRTGSRSTRTRTGRSCARIDSGTGLCGRERRPWPRHRFSHPTAVLRPASPEPSSRT